MSMHPTITAALAEQHRRDLTARAETYRIARTARGSRPAAPRHAADQARTLPRLITTAWRMAARLPLLHVSAAEGASSES
jgi:hypothetical protein